MQKIEYLKNEKSFLDEIKNIFHSFWKAIIWWKIKISWKMADTSFNHLWPYISSGVSIDLPFPRRAIQ